MKSHKKMVSSCLPLWAHLAVSVLGAAIGSAGALIFIFVFDNKHAGMQICGPHTNKQKSVSVQQLKLRLWIKGFWSLLSALLCFCLIHLHSLHWYKALPAMYTKHSLAWIKYAAVILAIMSGVGE